MAYSTGAVEQALKFITEKLRSGEWAEGSRIPTEDQLCAQIEVSRIAVREAIEHLVSLSVLTKIQGSGTYVRPLQDASIMGFSYYPVTRERVLDVLEFRKMTDTYNTRLFIRNATADERRALEENYQSMEKAILEGDAQAMHRADQEFHDLIAHGTHNLMIAKLSEMLTELLTCYQFEEQHNMGTEHVLKYHGLMLEAIRDNNEELASLYCAIHIENAIKRNRERSDEQ